MSTSPTPAESPTVTRNKAVCAEFFNGLFRDKDWSVAEKVLSPSYTYNGAPATAAGAVKFAKAMFQLIRGAEFTLEMILGEGDQVALRWSITGRMFGVIPQNVNGTNILSVDANGLIASNWQSGGRSLLMLLLQLVQRVLGRS